MEWIKGIAFGLEWMMNQVHSQEPRPDWVFPPSLEHHQKRRSDHHKARCRTDPAASGSWLLLLPLHRRELKMRIKTLSDIREASHSKPGRESQQIHLSIYSICAAESTAQTDDAVILFSGKRTKAAATANVRELPLAYPNS
ncbi:hypothetical protein INR49_009896 [Caranx melampygus]|nr:hypothetical protein INR49_009896 [Caranx melampygus]